MIQVTKKGQQMFNDAFNFMCKGKAMEGGAVDNLRARITGSKDASLTNT